jgi:hypothetical protein
LQVDKFALDALNENAEGYMHNLEQWILVCANHIKKSEPLGQNPPLSVNEKCVAIQNNMCMVPPKSVQIVENGCIS